MMNLLARILSHGFAFAVVAIIIIVLMYRGELFEEWGLPEFLAIKSQPVTTAETGSGTVDRRSDETTAPADSAETTPEPDKDVLASDSTSAETDDIQADDETPAVDGKSSAESDVTAGIEIKMPAVQTEAAEPVASSADLEDAGIEPPVTDPSVDTASTPQTADDAAASTDDDTASEDVSSAVDDVTAPATEEVAPAEATAVAEPAMGPAAAPVTEQLPQTVDDTTVADTPYAVMAGAREAYWLRDFETAEQQYRKLTQIDPDNPDGYGEMGNMYFSQGKWDEAAAAYYEAGTRLLNEGLIVQARQMLEVIRGLNGSQADELEAQIQSVATISP